jgi:hypothetical protein
LIISAAFSPIMNMRMDVAPRGAPALTVFLRDLIDAETSVILGIAIHADAELRLARRLQKNLLHRIVGANLLTASGPPLP